MRRLTPFLSLAALVGLTLAGLQIGDRARPPAATTPTAGRSPKARFMRDVVPVLDRRCGSCHGVPAAVYRRLEADADGRKLFRWPTDERGRLGRPELAAEAYARCTTRRGHVDPLDRANPALASQILVAPLAETYAGTSLTHPACFATPDDPDFRTLRAWVEAEIRAAPEAAAELTGEAERFFAAQVVPILARKTCFGSNCHGPLAFNDLKLHPGVPLLPGRFTADMHRHNRLSMLGRLAKQIRMVHLAGDLEQSRQLLKNIPLAQGGILHKGGNAFFEKGDPDYRVLLQWLQLEAAEARRVTGAALGRQQGIVFVRRPRDTPERYFEDEAFLPGADLFWRHDGREVNLTAALHPDGPADIRTPDVSHDARRVVFAMRRRATEPFDIWELELATRRARQLTFSPGLPTHYRDPQYVPGPPGRGPWRKRVCLALVSNASGEWAPTSPDGLLGEADGGDRQAIVDAELTQRPGTFDRRWLRVVRGTNRGQRRQIARHLSGRLELATPFARPCDATTHYVVEIPARRGPSYDLYRMRLAAPGKEGAVFAQTLSRISHALGQVRRPAVRSTGEVMFTSLRSGWQSGRPFFNGAVFRTFDNGANFHTHNGNRSVIPILADNRELPSGLEIRVGRDADSWWGGTLIISDHQFGPNIDPANPTDDLDHPYKDGAPRHGLHRFFSAWVPLDPRATTGGISPGGAYRDPIGLPDGSLLVAYAPGPLDLSDPTAAPDFDIVRIVPAPAYQSADGLRGGTVTRERVLGRPDAAELWPRPVVVRPLVRIKKKLKWATDLFGTPQQIRSFPGYSERTPAQLQVFDLVLLDMFFEQSVPAGVRHLHDRDCAACGRTTPRDERITHARVIAAVPQRAGDSGPLARYILAELPLAEDGSFHVVVPPGVPFDVQSLNADRMAQRMPNRWLYAHPGEKHTLSIPRTLYTQTCNGCHGTLTGKPTTSFGRPDVITSASRTQAIWDVARGQRRAPTNLGKGDVLTPAPFSVGFEEDIRPILTRRCVGCHGDAADAAAGLRLAGDGAFAALRAQVAHREALARKSPLLERLLGRELSAPRPLKHREPHPPGTPLSRPELLQLIRWVDLGAPRRRVRRR